MTAVLNVAYGLWLGITIALGVLVEAGYAARGIRRIRRRRKQAGDGTIAMLCQCCNGAKGDDCICTDNCGVPRCQAAEEVPHG